MGQNYNLSVAFMTLLLWLSPAIITCQDKVDFCIAPKHARVVSEVFLTDDVKPEGGGAK